MRTVTLLNEKGGVGKTTLSITIASGFAIRGKRVLLIDADPQAHCTQQMRMDEYGSLYRMLIQGTAWQGLLVTPDPKRWRGAYPQDGGELFLMPGNVETRAIPQMTSDVMALRTALDCIGDYVDLIVIDTPPTPSLWHAMLYMATDAVIIPTQCEGLSLDGTGKTEKHFGELNRTRQQFGLASARLLGVQPTMFDRNTNAHRFGLSLIVNHFTPANVWQPITERTVWRDASYAQKSIYAHAPESESAYEAWELIDRVQEKLYARA